MNIKTLLLAAFLFTPSLLLAQATPPKTAPAAGTPAAEPEAQATEKPLEKLKPGVVASYGRYTNRGKALDQGLDDSVPGNKDTSPVIGSVKKFGSARCAAVLTNNSEDKTFSVSFELAVSTKETVNSPQKKYFSATLGPKKSVEREFHCEPTDILELSLKSGREIRNK